MTLKPFTAAVSALAIAVALAGTLAGCSSKTTKTTAAPARVSDKRIAHACAQASTTVSVVGLRDSDPQMTDMWGGPLWDNLNGVYGTSAGSTSVARANFDGGYFAAQAPYVLAKDGHTLKEGKNLGLWLCVGTIKPLKVTNVYQTYLTGTNPLPALKAGEKLNQIDGSIFVGYPMGSALYRTAPSVVSLDAAPNRDRPARWVHTMPTVNGLTWVVSVIAKGKDGMYMHTLPIVKAMDKAGKVVATDGK